MKLSKTCIIIRISLLYSQTIALNIAINSGQVCLEHYHVDKKVEDNKTLSLGYLNDAGFSKEEAEKIYNKLIHHNRER